MISQDMKFRRERAMQKVFNAIKEHGGTTLLSTGITGNDAQMAKAAVDAGARLLEPNHSGVALARGFKGVLSLNEAEEIRHEVPLEDVLTMVRGIRNVVGEEIFITVGVPGGFTEAQPVILSDEDFYNIARAGADCLHTHKSSYEDLEQWVDKAHKAGLVVDAYIDHPDDPHKVGIPAATPEEVSKVAKTMEEMGIDLIGLMTGMTYQGLQAGEIHPIVKERLAALIETVENAPTIIEGGINPQNYKAFRGTGVDIIVVGTSFDQLAKKAVQEAVKKYVAL